MILLISIMIVIQPFKLHVMIIMFMIVIHLCTQTYIYIYKHIHICIHTYIIGDEYDRLKSGGTVAESKELRAEPLLSELAIIMIMIIIS